MSLIFTSDLLTLRREVMGRGLNDHTVNKTTLEKIDCNCFL